MHRIILDIEDSAFETVNYLINSLPSNDVHIISDSIVKQFVDKPFVNKQRLKQLISQNKLFETIDNPVQWQREIRNEW